MAGVEAYAPCPCGSGQKFKWCCQKVESFADRAQRLVGTGQIDAAIKVLDEGLRKEPGNPWLSTRKAIAQMRSEDPEGAKVTLRLALNKNPKHFGSLVLLTRCVLETEGPVNGAGMFQELLGAVDQTIRQSLAPMARLVAYLLGESQKLPAAIKHLDLVIALGDPDGSATSALRSFEASPTVSPWLKDRLTLALAPSDLPADRRARFDEGLALAERGQWAPAAAIFDHLAGDDPGGPADYNLGACRLWLGDEIGAVGPLRRRSRRLGTTTEAVDLEVLCQLIEPIHPEDRVEHIKLIWPLRDREGLLSSLRAAADIFDDGPGLMDPTDPKSPESDQFALLDRPQIVEHDGKGLSFDQIPRILGRVSVGQDTVALETYDDGRVDTLGDRLTALAGRSIAPAHPRTKVLDETTRSSLALAWEWLFPAGIEPAEAERLDRDKRAQILRDIWPDTPMPFLNFRTPAQAGRDGDAVVPLRAALCQHELDRDLELAGFDYAGLRARLGVPPEPTLDPATVVVDQLPLARLAAVPVDQLDDTQLVAYYRRVRRSLIGPALDAAGRAIVARPFLFERDEIDPMAVHSDLASLAAGRGERDQALDWINRGRQTVSPKLRAASAPLWDMLEVRLLSRLDQPEQWVPELAVVLERHAEDPTANQVILMNLIEMGLARLEPNPDNREDFLLDTRPLQALLAEYGPRVTTASGRLGVSAARPEVWTPGGPASGSGGALWTPGSGSAGTAATGGEKPKLILPGR